MTHVKICGTTNLDDAIVATDAGADLLGFILYPKSPRYVAPETIAAIVRGLRDHSARVPLLVGVFVNVAPAKSWQRWRRPGSTWRNCTATSRPVPSLHCTGGRSRRCARPRVTRRWQRPISMGRSA